MRNVATNILIHPATTGPGRFGRLLAKGLLNHGIALIPEAHALGADIYFGSGFFSEGLVVQMKRLGKPCIIRLDGIGELFPYENFNDDKPRVAFSEANADFRIYQSEFARQNISRLHPDGISLNDQYAIIHNGVVYPDNVHIELKDKPFISISHNWTPFRNHNYLNVMFDNLQAIVDAIPDFQWRIVGNNHELKAAATGHCDLELLRDHVKFVPFIDNPNEYRKQAGACIHIVGRDACPNSLIESMSYGLPCITWEESGGAELVRNNHCGVVVGDNKPETIIEAIKNIKDNHRDYGIMARKSIDNLDIDVIVKQYADVFNRFFN